MGSDTLIDTFSRLRVKLHRAAMGLLRNEMEAQDAVQDAFVNLWGARMPETDAEARNRLFLVLRNVCLNKLRSRRASISLDGLEITADNTDTGDAERLKELALRALTPQQREIFELIVLGDMDYPEAAARLGLSVEAVRTHMSRARKKIRQQFTDLDL